LNCGRSTRTTLFSFITRISAKIDGHLAEDLSKVKKKS
jgi:hypothetical protein